MRAIKEHFKKYNGVAIGEIALGVFIAILALRLLSVLFGRQSIGTIFGAENAEDLENLGGRGRARRQAKRTARRDTRAHNKDVKYKRAVNEGRAAGSGGRLKDEETPDEGSLPSDEEYEEALEFAEYMESLSQEDIDNMSDAEYAEYAEYAENVANAQ